MDKKQIRAAKIKRQQELLDAAKKAGNRSLTDTEQAEFDSLQSEIDTLTEEIRAAENPQTPADPAPAQNPPPAAPANANRSTDPAPGPEDNIQRAIAAERTRVNEITAVCRDFGVSESDYIQNGSTVEQSWITCARTAHPSALAFRSPAPARMNSAVMQQTVC